MAFTKGDKNINRGGRGKGTKNRVNEVLKESITHFLNKNFGQIQKDFEGLNGGQRVRYYLDFLKFVLPTLSTQQVTEFDKLSDEQLEILYHRLLNKAKDNEKQ